MIKSDHFFRNPLPKFTSPVTGLEEDDYNSPDSVDAARLIEAVRNGMEDASCQVLIVEGILLFCHPGLLPLLGLKVFIDLDADVRMHRRVSRNTKGFTRFENNNDPSFHFNNYLHFARFRDQMYTLPSKIHADLILNGYKLDGIAVDMLEMWIKSRINNN